MTSLQFAWQQHKGKQKEEGGYTHVMLLCFKRILRMGIPHTKREEEGCEGGEASPPMWTRSKKPKWRAAGALPSPALDISRLHQTPFNKIASFKREMVCWRVLTFYRKDDSSSSHVHIRSWIRRTSTNHNKPTNACFIYLYKSNFYDWRVLVIEIVILKLVIFFMKFCFRFKLHVEQRNPEMLYSYVLSIDRMWSVRVLISTGRISSTQTVTFTIW